MHVSELPEILKINAQEVGKVHTHTIPIAINNPPIPSFFEVRHLFSSQVLLAPSSPPFFV